MLDLKTVGYDAPAIGARIAEFLNNGSNPPLVVVENRSPVSGGATASIRFQESDDGSTWTDVPDTVVSVAPGTVEQKVITSSRSRLALFASGNVPLLVSVLRTVDGSPTNLGAA